MDISSSKYVLVGVLALVVGACGNASTPTAEDAVSSSTQAPTSTGAPEAATTSMAHMDESHDEQAPSDESDSGAPEMIYQVSMTEFEFEPGSYTISAGQPTTFVITNDGVIEHEFRVSNEHRIEEHIAAGHEDHGSEAEHHEGGDVVVLVQPGESEELTVSFPEDMTVYTEIACLLPGHYEAGMKADLDYTTG